MNSATTGAAGSSSSIGSNAAAGNGAPLEVQHFEAGPASLMSLVRPSISQPHDPKPLPVAFLQAEALFEEARGDYEGKKRYESAAGGFLAAAKVLLSPAGPYDEAFTGNRQICYRNAAAALAAAKDPAGAIAALTAAKRGDPHPASAVTLDELLADFIDPP